MPFLGYQAFADLPCLLGIKMPAAAKVYSEFSHFTHSQSFEALLMVHLHIFSSRVAEVGKLSASAKNAFNSFVGRVFANSRQKTLFFRVLPKLQQKGSFYLILPSFY